MMKSSKKSYFKGVLIASVGALITGNGVFMLLEAIEEKAAEIMIMVTEEGYGVLNAFLHMFGGIVGLGVLVVGAFFMYEGVKKAGFVGTYKKKNKISVNYCPRTKRIK